MKKYLIIVIAVVLLAVGLDYVFFGLGWYIDLHPNAEVTAFVKTDGKNIILDSGEGYEKFEIRGVDMGSGIPGEWSTSFAGKKAMYLNWFEEIQAMGANTIRVYTVNSTDFYRALYEFNTTHDKPLYLLQGVWVDEYAQFSHLDAYSREFVDEFCKDCLRVIDVIHGRRKIGSNDSSNAASGRFVNDVSPWTLGYIIGVEWETDVVTYTNDKYRDDPEKNTYTGEYMYTTEDASPFEAMLAYVGDSMLKYESGKYKQQRLLAFSNWPATDPFEYPEEIQKTLGKIAAVDVEHICLGEKAVSGQFASYHIYPYYPAYVNYLEDWSIYGIENKQDYIDGDEILSYRAYLYGIANHHEMPVIISEFGIPSSRGMACEDPRSGRNQGGMSEKEQGEALVACYKDIMESGCAGSCVFAWQDEWFKRTWNTLHAVDLKRNPYWSDYQTNEQFFGILTFEPGSKDTVCHVNGNPYEWTESDKIITENGASVSMRYDEKFVYFLVEKNNLYKNHDVIYIPIDTTQKSGSSYCENYGLNFDRDADFLIVIDGKDNSRLLVQERYEAVRSTYSKTMYGYDTYLSDNIPDKNSSKFVPIYFPLQAPTDLIYGEDSGSLQFDYETGKLIYGMVDTSLDSFNSIADFCFGENCVEIRIPWQLLNFSDPSNMEIHDDYYENYGVAYQNINSMYIGVSTAKAGENEISLAKKTLFGWGNTVHYRERLKESYYALQEVWTASDSYESETKEEHTVTISVESGIPAIMYHDFVPKPGELGEYAIWTEDFEQDLIYLRDNGYHTISVDDVIAYENGEKSLPENPILITVDDARLGFYQEAYPLLKKYNMKANVAVIAGEADYESIQADKGAREPFFCTWNELKEMQDSGLVTVISHTANLHDTEDNANISDARLAANDYLEIHDTMSRHLGTVPTALSYPLSKRTQESDEIWAGTGYSLLLCGDHWDLMDYENITFDTTRNLKSNIKIIPRLSRSYENGIEYYIRQWIDIAERVLRK